MNRYREVIDTYLAKLHLTDRSIPLLFLFLVVVAFGLLIPWLGLYWDDWPVIFINQLDGAKGFIDFYRYDRPTSVWTYLVLAPILGTKPVFWHIYTLIMRWLTVSVMWVTLRTLWPGRDREVTWAALLFAVYPVFNQQSIGVTYNQAWLEYLLFFTSIFLMMRAVHAQQKAWIFLTLSALALLLNLSISEYFIGMEALRPLILWWLFKQQCIGNKQTLAKTLRYWLPYVVICILFLYWRLFLVQIEGDPNSLKLLTILGASPSAGIMQLAQISLQDIVYLLWGIWGQTIRIEQLDLGRIYFYFTAGISVVAASVIAVYLSKLKFHTVKTEMSISSSKWIVQALVFGLLTSALGFLPAWSLNRQATVGLYSSRFALVAMFGASIILAALIEWLSDRPLQKIVVVSILLGMSINYHLWTAKDYRDSWEKQQRVYWQLYWRAPNIEPGTAIISDGEIFRFVGLYSTSMAITLLFPPPDDPQTMPYWFFDMVHQRLYNKTDELFAGLPLNGSLRSYAFEGNSREALILYLPDENQCLRILTDADFYDREIPDILQPVIPLSNLGRIQPAPVDGWLPPQSIFGKEPEHTWCYFFEKADLARQYQDWEKIIGIMEQAQQQGYSPARQKEYLPLLNAYLYTGRIDEARKLTKQIKIRSDMVDDLICHTWLNAKQDNPSEALDKAFQNVREELRCFD